MLPAYLLMCLIYGTTFLAIKVGLGAGFPPFLFAGIRFVVAALVILGFFVVRGQKLPRTRAELVPLLLIGVGNTLIPFGCLYTAERVIPSGLAAMLTSTGPAIVTFFSMRLERRRPDPEQWLGLALGLVGVVLLVAPSVELGANLSLIVVPVVSVLLAQVAAAWATVQSKRVLSMGVAPLAVNGIQMLTGGLGLLVLSLAFERAPLHLVEPTRAAGALAYLMIFGSLIGSGIYFWLVKKTNPLFPSTWLYVSPMIALWIGAAVLGEPLHASSFGGAVLVLAGVLLTNLRMFRGKRLIPAART